MIPFQVQAGKPLRAIVCDRSGATAVEFAFIAPVFLTMVMGIMDFGHSVYARAELNGSVQQAARSSTMESSFVGQGRCSSTVRVAAPYGLGCPA